MSKYRYPKNNFKESVKMIHIYLERGRLLTSRYFLKLFHVECVVPSITHSCYYTTKHTKYFPMGQNNFFLTSSASSSICP